MVALFPLKFGDQAVEVALCHGRYHGEGKAADSIAFVIIDDMTGFQAAVHGVFFVKSYPRDRKITLLFQALFNISAEVSFEAA